MNQKSWIRLRVPGINLVGPLPGSIGLLEVACLLVGQSHGHVGMRMVRCELGASVQKFNALAY